ncbi:Uncharacterized protein Adt_30348 [Abeliophyllum distichum]|uniref:Uncharacterized protein n=1 Tax=Abeliophyllum distichum TaxID=126358 RepID=A0ABD1RB07_9LAMI
MERRSETKVNSSGDESSYSYFSEECRTEALGNAWEKDSNDNVEGVQVGIPIGEASSGIRLKMNIDASGRVGAGLTTTGPVIHDEFGAMVALYAKRSNGQYSVDDA